MGELDPRDEVIRALVEERMWRPVSRRQFMTILGVGAVGLSASSILAACSSAATPAPATSGPTAAPATAGAGTPQASTPALSGTINWMGFDGEEGGDLPKAWLAEHNLTLKTTPTPQSDMVVAQAKLGNVIDVAAVNNGYLPVLSGSGLLIPLDLSRIPNAADQFPVLANVPWGRDSNGQVVALPLLWGDGPAVYNPAKVTELPKGPLELADPKWKGRLVFLDDPYYEIFCFAGAMGYKNPLQLTADDLAKVVEKLRPAIKNAVAIAGSFGELTDYLVRGEADLAPQAWEAMIGMAAEKQITLKYGTIPGNNFGWSDSYVIPKTAKNIDAAYAFTDFMFSPETNAKLATNLASGVGNAKAFDLLSADMQKLYDYSIVRDVNSPVKIAVYVPSPTKEGNFTASADWAKAWSSLKV
jgi:putative spermidine/putrescine transport system substrate-binding protein